MPSASLSPTPAVTLPSRDMVLWDVVEEHLAEAAFCLEQFEQALDHPSRTLSELDRHPEGRLLAHIDALVIGGAVVRDRLLLSELENAAADEPGRVTAAAIALIDQGCFDALLSGVTHEDAAVRDATVRAAWLAGGDALDRWAASRLTTAASPSAIAALLQLHAARGLSVSTLHKWLRSDDPAILTAAVRAARWADSRSYRASVEALLAHPESSVREAALESALCLGSQRAWTLGQRWVLDGNESPHVLALCSALGGRELIAQLARDLDLGGRRTAVLFALTFSGDSRQVPSLIEQLRSNNALHAKLALQAIAGITGLDLRDDAFALPAETADDVVDAEMTGDRGEALATLPPLEEDDLDANLVPQPEEALPRPNPDAVERFWSERASSFDPKQRYLAGNVFSTDALLKNVECAPLRWRHTLALSLCVRGGGAAAWVDTRTWSATQRKRIAAVRTKLVSGLAQPLGTG